MNNSSTNSTTLIPSNTSAVLPESSEALALALSVMAPAVAAGVQAEVPALASVMTCHLCEVLVSNSGKVRFGWKCALHQGEITTYTWEVFTSLLCNDTVSQWDAWVARPVAPKLPDDSTVGVLLDLCAPLEGYKSWAQGEKLPVEAASTQAAYEAARAAAPSLSADQVTAVREWYRAVPSDLWEITE